MHVCLIFSLFLTFATFTVLDSLALVSFFIRLSCVFSVTSCFTKASNQQPHRKCQDIVSFMAMSFLSPSSRCSGRSGGEGMWRNSSLCPDRFFFLSQIRTHIARQENERGREGQKTVEKKRFWKKVMTFYGCGYLLFCLSCSVLHSLFLMLGLTIGEVISMRVALPELGPWTLSQRGRDYLSHRHSVVCITEYAFSFQDYRAGFLHINW